MYLYSHYMEGFFSPRLASMNHVISLGMVRYSNGWEYILWQNCSYSYRVIISCAESNGRPEQGTILKQSPPVLATPSSVLPLIKSPNRSRSIPQSRPMLTLRMYVKNPLAHWPTLDAARCWPWGPTVRQKRHAPLIREKVPTKWTQRRDSTWAHWGESFPSSGWGRRYRGGRKPVKSWSGWFSKAVPYWNRI